ncbi:MAG: DUF4012 domain-containing protein [Microbacteriaceae bacterium]
MNRAYPRRSRERWLIRGGVALGAIGVIFVGVWIAIHAMLAQTQLADARAQLREFQEQFNADPNAALPHLHAADEHLGQAESLTNDVFWRAASFTPIVGPQLNAVAVMSSALRTAVHDGVFPLIDAGLGDPAVLIPQGGHIDIAAIAELAAPANDAQRALALASEQVNTLQPDGLLTPIAEGVRAAQSQLSVAANGASALAQATQLIPSMLGGDDAKNYLLMFQNNAEWRSLGGIASSFALVRAAGGELALVDQASSSDFQPFPEPVLPLSTDALSVFGTQPGRWIQDVTQLPDYEHGAAIAREMWLRSRGVAVDGVIAIDPVALSYIIQATGPITLSNGAELRSDNAVSMLLSEVYQDYPNPVDQDVFFAETAATIFTKLTSGDFAPRKFLDALMKASSEQRILLWSQDAKQQELIAGTSLAGGLPATTATATGVGVYLNDATGAKMDFWMQASPSAAWTSPTGDMHIELHLKNTAPADAAETLPRYVTGGGEYGVPAGTTRTVVYMLMPAGFTFVSDESSLPQARRSLASYQNRAIVTWTIDLAPGEDATVAVNASGPFTSQVNLVSTPVIPQT